jgi:uncharacterized SAM-binding protein YcdF (DUF218 family)
MFFLPAKIFWFLLQPSSILMLAIAVALVAMAYSRMGLARRSAVIALAIALIAMSPLPQIVRLPLEDRFQRADLSGRPITGFVVLGGSEESLIATGRGLHAINEAGERVTEAAALARRLPAARIVVSGGSGELVPGRRSEAEVTRDLLVSIGVDADRIEIETTSRDTYENAVKTVALVRPSSGQRWLLVTSASHMPRAVGCFRVAGFPVEAWPVDYRTRGPGDTLSVPPAMSKGLSALDQIVREYIGLVTYRLVGRTDALLPAP